MNTHCSTHLQTLVGHTVKPIHLTLKVLFLALMLAIPSTVLATQADHILLIVLEGIKSSTIQDGKAPTLAKLAKEGAVTWSAQSITPPLTVSAMASLLTGLPVEKHRVGMEWEQYDFGRSFMRAPTVFDYMDLAGGSDTGVFLMDERLYQLVRPEIYVDSQVCGYTKPECTPQTVSVYIKDFLTRVTSEGGYGFRLFGVPNLLLAHLPTAARMGQKYGWDSKQYHAELSSTDTAIDLVIGHYQDLDVLDRTMVMVTGLNGGPVDAPPQKGGNASIKSTTTTLDTNIPWIAWGANIKSNHAIAKPVSLLDTGATIMYALGLETHTEWDSQSVNEIFQSTPKKRTTENE